jgi:hypothetical protein
MHYKKLELLTLPEHLSSLPVFDPFSLFVFFYYVSLHSELRVVMSVTISAKINVRFVFTFSCL